MQLYAEVFAACDGEVLQISENSSGTLIAVTDNDSVTGFNTKDYSPVDKFYDGKISKISFYSEGENEFLALITDTGLFIVRKLIKTESGWSFEKDKPYYSADCSDVSGRKTLETLSFSSN